MKWTHLCVLCRDNNVLEEIDIMNMVITNNLLVIAY